MVQVSVQTHEYDLREGTHGTEKTMKVKTSRFGEIEVNPERLITLTAPFLGFSESLRFVLRPHKPDSPFMWLQAVDNPDLAFVVIQAAMIMPDYKPGIAGFIKKELQIVSASEMDILLILTIPDGKPREMTANLLGPVMINTKKRLARQVLLDPAKYDPCQPVFSDGKD